MIEILKFRRAQAYFVSVLNPAVLTQQFDPGRPDAARLILQV